MLVNTKRQLNLSNFNIAYLQRICAHKFVLSIGSNVFGAMLNNPHFQQFSNENPMQQEVHVDEIEPDIFKTILKFLYTDKVNLDPDNVMAILYAGKLKLVGASKSMFSSEVRHHLSGVGLHQLFENQSVYRKCNHNFETSAVF
jgi:hypothetical protein